jgi:hypothetical protein
MILLYAPYLQNEKKDSFGSPGSLGHNLTYPGLPI